jgi:hypothetical protein
MEFPNGTYVLHFDTGKVGPDIYGDVVTDEMAIASFKVAELALKSA